MKELLIMSVRQWRMMGSLLSLGLCNFTAGFVVPRLFHKDAGRMCEFVVWRWLVLVGKFRSERGILLEMD